MFSSPSFNPTADTFNATSAALDYSKRRVTYCKKYKISLKEKLKKKALTGNDAERQSMVVIKKIGSFQNQVTLGFKKHKLSASLAAQLDSSGKKKIVWLKKKIHFAAISGKKFDLLQLMFAWLI